MTKQLYLAVLIIGIFCLPVIGTDGPSVLSPNTSAYSASELAALQAQMSDLQDILSDYALGSKRYFSTTEWMSQDFAAYTAGVLAARGYTTRLVSQEGWPEGEHVWVLVGVPLPTRMAWVPVEASPALGKPQKILGHVPSFVDAGGQMWFEKEYVRFTSEVSLPENASPVASIRVVPTHSLVGQEVTFMALASYDPDGEIVSYSWDLGGMETSNRCTIRHAFTQAGTYKIELSVVDSRGKTVVASIDYKVRAIKEQGNGSSDGGCGCGG